MKGVKMKASEIINRLKELIEKHGDLEVGLYGDHEPTEQIDFNSKSWVTSGHNHAGKTIPAFEFNGYGDMGDEE